jgi:hypothetical protein
MLFAYLRASTGDHSTDLRQDTLLAADAKEREIYLDKVSEKRERQPGLQLCLTTMPASPDSTPSAVAPIIFGYSLVREWRILGMVCVVI